MVMPLHDDAPLRFLRVPIVNYGLIAANILIFLAVSSEMLGAPINIFRGFGVVPSILFGEARLADWMIAPPAPLTLVTSLFFHSSLWHLGGNMLFLYVFGDNVEDAMGSLYYLLFYLCCGVGAGVFFVYAAQYFEPHLATPLVGASGAISGVCAAFLLLYPNATIFGLAGGFIPIHASASMFVGTWILLQGLNALFGEAGHVAWTAHVGGILAGLIFTPIFKRRRLRLLDFGADASKRRTVPAPPADRE